MFLGSREWSVHKADLTTTVSRLSTHCGILNISKPYRPLWPVMGTVYLSLQHYIPEAGTVHSHRYENFKYNTSTLYREEERKKHYSQPMRNHILIQIPALYRHKYPSPFFSVFQNATQVFCPLYPECCYMGSNSQSQLQIIYKFNFFFFCFYDIF
jgi:hypothetical protein